jgi:catechol 2,3-dioxygenase-like lactoylglutathione lyase family enzyme
MRLLPLICLVALGGNAMGQTPAPRPAAAVSGRGAFWALSVADVKSMSQWYSDKFGLHVTLDPPRSGGAKAIVLEGDGLIVELIQHESAKPRRVIAPAASDAVLIHGIMKAGLVVDDFDKTIASFRAANVAIAYGPYPARRGQRANAIIRDPEGNLIQLFGR